MSDMVERVARAMFMRSLPKPGDIEYTGELWPDRCDEGNGPPFEADGWRELARIAIKTMREPTDAMVHAARSHSCYEQIICDWQDMIDEALK